MSSQIVVYVIYGVMLPYDAIETDGEDDGAKIEPYRDNAFKRDSANPKGNVTYIGDGMDGEWAAVGHIIARSDEFGHGLPNTTISGKPNKKWAVEVDLALVAMGVENPGSYPKGWHVITNYR
jgi:hypothetical protein